MDADVRPAAASRRYSPEQKEHAVRMVPPLREELGVSAGTVTRVVGAFGEVLAQQAVGVLVGAALPW